MKTRIIKVKKNKRKEVEEKKWHKTLLKNTICILKEVCPILDLENKNLCISIEIDSYRKVTNIIFHYKDFKNEIFAVSDIIHEKAKIKKMCVDYSLNIKEK